MHSDKLLSLSCCVLFIGGMVSAAACGSGDEAPDPSTTTGSGTGGAGTGGDDGGAGGAGADGGGGTSTFGDPCPEPPQGPIGADWPEVFVGVAGCDDAGPGTEAEPVCTVGEAFTRLPSAPGIVSFLDGTYRLVDQFPAGKTPVVRAGTADAYFVVRAAEGASPLLLGSRPLSGADFEDRGGGLWRVDVSGLPEGPRGFWAADGTRLIHEMVMIGGVRSHADVSDLTDEGTWTKADDGGTGCPNGDNAGCYVYLRPPAGMDVPSTDFEASQGNFFYAGSSDYMVIRGLSIRFTHSTSIFFEGADHILVEQNELAHNANSNDNAYSLRVWNAEGAMIRNNRVHDSRYWGGLTNSWGITFMLAGETEPLWVCNNEIWDIYWAAVGSKGGASQVQMVQNYIHDVHLGAETPNSRCHWQGCDEHHWPAGNWTIRENVFEGCQAGVEIRATLSDPEMVSPSRIYNNLFVDCDDGVHVKRASIPPMLRNNVFEGGRAGIFFSAGGTDTWPDYYLAGGFDSDFNLFHGQYAVYVNVNWSGSEQGYGLAEYQTAYGAEASSLAADPQLGPAPDYAPASSSPVFGAGDPGTYDGVETVNLGPWPFL